MRIATIDIGTNSVLLLVAERRSSGLVPLVDEATITRLGQGVDAQGTLHPAAVERTLACLERYAKLVAESGVERVAIVGTSAMRDASGGESFLERARELVGTTPQIVSGMREAELTFRGALSGLELAGAVAVFDVGGGSTEIVVGSAQAASVTIEAAVSLDIGAVRLTERHIRHDPPEAAELLAAGSTARAALAAAPDLRGRPLVGVAGTITTLAALARHVAPYDGAKVHGAVLAREEIERLHDELAREPLAQRRDRPELDPMRADVIVAGAVVALAVCDHAGASELTVSDRGVRWGLAAELADR
jgi:exopolyphosphatase/guanosine-5'-triphosphate,3'-diphosphate pyrophosphatase